MNDSEIALRLNRVEWEAKAFRRAKVVTKPNQLNGKNHRLHSISTWKREINQFELVRDKVVANQSSYRKLFRVNQRSIVNQDYQTEPAQPQLRERITDSSSLDGKPIRTNPRANQRRITKIEGSDTGLLPNRTSSTSIKGKNDRLELVRANQRRIPKIKVISPEQAQPQFSLSNSL